MTTKNKFIIRSFRLGVLLCLLMAVVVAYNFYRINQNEQELSLYLQEVNQLSKAQKHLAALEKLSEILNKYPAESSDAFVRARLRQSQLIAFTVKQQDKQKPSKNTSTKQSLRPILAVVDFTINDEAIKRGIKVNGKYLACTLLDEMDGKRYQRVIRTQLDKVMKELRFQASDLADPKKAKKVGKHIGAELLISGTVFVDGAQYQLYCVFFEVETGRILQTAKIYGNNAADLKYMLKEAALVLNMNSNEKQKYLTEKAKYTVGVAPDLLSASHQTFNRYKRKCSVWFSSKVKIAEKKCNQVYHQTKLMFNNLKKHTENVETQAVQSRKIQKQLFAFSKTRDYKLGTTKSRNKLQELKKSIDKYQKKLVVEKPVAACDWTVLGLKLPLVFIPADKNTKDFWIGKYEISNDDYLQFLNATGNSKGIDLSDNDCPLKKEKGKYVLNKKSRFGQHLKQPVVEVSWNGASEFCKWLTQKESKAGRLPKNYVYRLASKQEWNRATNKANKILLEETTWSWNNASNTTHRVGTKAPNQQGLYDMRGNVREWLTGDYDSLSENAKSTTNGSWSSTKEQCKINKPGIELQNSKTNNLGFRIVLALKVATH